MDAALRNCRRLADLVNDLLDLDSIESGYRTFQRGPVNINRILEEALADFTPRCDSEGQTISLARDGDLPPILGDNQMVTQVMVNLIGNAHKFTPEGGEITIRGLRTAEGVRVEIRDTGPGIDQADQEKVFEKFTQLTRKDGPGARGTGLGLAITHKIIELLGGQLGLESEPGKGSNFHFTLPIYNTAAHMQALVADGIHRSHVTRMDWTLILMKP
jgi:signal transduction histidine kinase